MLLTLTTTHRPATDLGFVLRKNPANVRTVATSFGEAHVFWPEATDERATVALLVEIDPVNLVRSRRARQDAADLTHFVNDRPYATSSLMSAAISRLFGSAMGGESPERPGLATTAMPLSVHLPVVPARGGEDMVTRLFEPLGYTVSARPIELDAEFPDWGASRYLDLRLEGTLLVADLLAHLYVLLPVLDDDKHYWVSRDEIDKLLRRGGEWLAVHPDRELIVDRYLQRRQRLTREALARLADDDSGGAADPDAEAEAEAGEELAIEERVAAEPAVSEERVSLNVQRLRAVVRTLRDLGASSVLDLGCGEGRLLAELLRDNSFGRIVGIDVSMRSLQVAARRLKLDAMPERRRARIEIAQGALTYRDARFAGFDAVTMIEVIEHVDPSRLDALEAVVFADARPRHVVVTTPNIEHNVRFASLPAGNLRHRDHRFEWTRAEFTRWADDVAERRGYRVGYEPIGPDDPEVGPPTQMAVFSR